LNFVKRTRHAAGKGFGLPAEAAAPNAPNDSANDNDGSNTPPMTVLYRAPSALLPPGRSKGFSSFGLSLFVQGT